MNVLPKGDSVDDEKVGDEKGFPLDGDDDVSSNPQRPKEERKGRRKINIEYIEDKSRRHITFSKRKAGIMKKVFANTHPCARCICGAIYVMYSLPTLLHTHDSIGGDMCVCVW
eukprot:TRINITY_DN1157_c0_g1_i1.p3 TRINITY_DN1157_c0_g1~~TRINITY_DN1157_c0_g1_i1.p3  ORF type:complete len:113 (-),score=23.86 TRINITY_DN1157_c0_g1_i1:1020-1358(-)